MGIPSDINTGLIYTELLKQTEILQEILAELRYANDCDADIESATAQGEPVGTGSADNGSPDGLQN